jgi:hypothetical protein
MIREKVYNDRDNVVSVGLVADGIQQDITGTTRMTLRVGKDLLDSAKISNIFDWTTNGATGRLDMANLGHQSLKEGEYTAQLTLYDASYTSGLVWDHMILEVIDV